MAGASEAVGGTEAPGSSFSGLGALAILLALVSAVASVLCGLVAMFGYPPAMLGLGVLPLFSMLAIALGGASLMRRVAPDGSAYSRGPAAGGVIVGLATLVLQGAVIVGVLRTYVPMKRVVVPVVASMLEESERGNTELARRALAETVRGVVTEARFEAFLDASAAETGRPMTAAFGLATIARTRAALVSAMAQGGGTVTVTGMYPKPVEFEGPSGRVSVWVLLDEAELERERVKIVDMMAILPGGRGVVLLPEGRFAQLVEQAGIERVALDGD